MEHQFKPWQPVVVKAKTDGIWEADFFCRYQEGSESPYLCTSRFYWKYCLTAEGNEHLVGTKDNPTLPEPEFKFGDKVEVRFHRQGWQQGVFISNDPGKEHPYGVCVRGFIHLTWFTHCRHADW